MSLNKQFGIDNIYVVHGLTGYEHREKMLRQLLKEQHDLDYELVTESADQEENLAWIKEYFVEDVRQILGKGALFCTLIHILCYQRMLKNNDQYAIIFENDVCFLSGFHAKISKVMDEVRHKRPGFLVSIENSTLKFPSFWKTKRGQYLYPAQAGRCAGAYIIDQQAARSILEDLKQNKCKEVIDWWHNDLINRNIFQMFWAHPVLTEQGSSNGKFTSSLSSNRKGNIRRFKWLMQKAYKMYILRFLKR